MRAAKRASLAASALRDAARRHLDAERTAIYLWGSVLSSDFLAESSDVDALLIGVSAADVAAAGAVRKDAHRAEPLLRRLDLTVVPLNALHHRWRPKPFDRIDPAVVLLEAGRGRLIFGSRNLLSSIAAAPASLVEELRLRAAAVRRRLRKHAADPLDEPPAYILKELGFACHVLHQLDTGPHPFSYAALQRHSTRATSDAVQALLAARKQGWNDLDAKEIRALAARLCREMAARGEL
jgi:predicted nucleotidyltransferase